MSIILNSDTGLVLVNLSELRWRANLMSFPWERCRSFGFQSRFAETVLACGTLVRNEPKPKLCLKRKEKNCPTLANNFRSHLLYVRMIKCQHLNRQKCCIPFLKGVSDCWGFLLASAELGILSPILYIAVTKGKGSLHGKQKVFQSIHFGGLCYTAHTIASSTNWQLRVHQSAGEKLLCFRQWVHRSLPLKSTEFCLTKPLLCVHYSPRAWRRCSLGANTNSSCR